MQTVKLFKNIIAMTIPVMMFQVVEFSNNFIDAIMIGRYDALLLGPATIGGIFYALSIVFVVGILLITGSLIGQASGAKNYDMMVRVVQSGTFLSIIFATLSLIWFWNIESVLQLLWFEDTLIQDVSLYLEGRMYSAIALVAIACRMFLVNQKLFRHILIINIFAMPLNILLNYMLIYGNFGMPELGLYGGGLATGISMCIISVCIIIFATLKGRKQNINLWRGFPHIDMYYKKRIIKLGAGIGFLITAEVVLFTAMNAYSGRFDPITIAGWGTVFQVWNMLFALVLGVAEACNIFLAEEAGKRDRKVYMAGIYMYTIIMMIMCGIFAILCIVYPQLIINIILDTKDANYTDIAAIVIGVFPLMIVGFILESYLQICSRTLVAMNDTNFMPCVMWIFYGVVGPIIGYVWVFIYDGGVSELMMTIIISIFLSAILGAWRVYYMTRPHRIFNKVET